MTIESLRHEPIKISSHVVRESHGNTLYMRTVL